MTSPHKIKFSYIKMKTFHLLKDTVQSEKTSHRVGEMFAVGSTVFIKNYKITRKRQKE